ncbi:hypothetical protein LUZ60_009790 [Juncus effusus]|nr:hypothetical protein LUZ60_009790 [Juncus effusus]
MATQSTPSPAPTQQIPGLEGEKKDAIEEASNPGSENPGFTNPDPIREDQVQNAVRFLSHPKVRGSPVTYRRSFLENKGLTKDEIDEAFRRVPDPSPSSGTNIAAPVTTQVAQPKAYTATATQPQVSQPTAVIAPPVPKRTFNWYHIVLATSLLAASGAGTAVFFKRVFVPRVKAWIRRVVSEKEEGEKEEEEKKSVRIAEEAAEAAKAAASAAALVAKASQDLLSSKNEEKGYFEAFMKALDVQVKEMKSMGETIKKLETSKNNNSINNNGSIEDQFHSTTTRNNNGVVNNPWGMNSSSWAGQRGTTNNGLPTVDYGLGRPNQSVPVTSEPVNLNPKSYAEMMSMGQQQRTEKPPSQKPWEAGPQAYQKPTYTPSYPQSHSSDEGSNPETQIPNNSDASSEPWWRKKSVKVTESEPESDESAKQQQIPYNPYNSGVNQRRWVPPQPPAVAMPEAVAAIRQPKNKPVVDEVADEVAGRGDEVVGKGDEVARFEAGGSSSGAVSVNEIVEEEESGNAIEVN